MKILGVFRDLAPARIAVHMYREAARQGVQSTIIAEGGAVPIFTEAELPLLLSGGDDLFPLREIGHILKNRKPDLLCIGISYPINWELAFAKEARRQGIPVVAIADIWGATDRLGDFVPDGVLVIDEWEALRLRKNGVRAEVIGDVSSLTQRVDPPKEQDARANLITRSLESTTLLLVGDNVGVIVEQAALTAQCVWRHRHPHDFTIIPRLVHPKQVNDPGVKEKVDAARNELSGLVVDDCNGWSTDQLAARCDYLCACFTTPLRTAVRYGKRALSLHGPRCSALLKEETGFETFPLVERGIVPPISIPVDFEIFNWDLLEERAQEWSEETQFRPAVALEKLLSIVA